MESALFMTLTRFSNKELTNVPRNNGKRTFKMLMPTGIPRCHPPMNVIGVHVLTLSLHKEEKKKILTSVISRHDTLGHSHAWCHHDTISHLWNDRLKAQGFGVLAKRLRHCRITCGTRVAWAIGVLYHKSSGDHQQLEIETIWLRTTSSFDHDLSWHSHQFKYIHT